MRGIKPLRCKGCKRLLGERITVNVPLGGKPEPYCIGFRCVGNVQRRIFRNMAILHAQEPAKNRLVQQKLKSWLYGNKRRTAELEKTPMMQKVFKHVPRKKLFYSQDFIAVRWE